MFDDVFTRKSVSEEDYEVLGLTSSATLDEVTQQVPRPVQEESPGRRRRQIVHLQADRRGIREIRADRSVPPTSRLSHSNSASGRSRSWPFGRPPGAGHQPLGPLRLPAAWAWWVTRAGQWRWAWVAAAVLALLAVIGTLSFARGSDPNSRRGPRSRPQPWEPRHGPPLPEPSRRRPDLPRLQRRRLRIPPLRNPARRFLRLSFAQRGP